MKTNKLLGQNFLRCKWVTSAMMRAADLTMSDTVLEVGAGTGVLTKELVKHTKKVIAIEKDKNLVVQYLRPLEKQYKNLEIVEGDILKNFSEISSAYLPAGKAGNLQPNSYKLVSNIPYYLTSRLLRILLEQGPQPKIIVLTVQKEVAERVCAKPNYRSGTSIEKMNLLAVSVQVFGKPEIIKKVPAACFWPKPKVDSAIIKISDISDDFFVKNSVSLEDFFKIVKKAFMHKRKMLVNTLGHVGSAEKSRPEELSLEKWAKLVRALSAPY